MYCKQCGAEIEDGARFCSKCRAKQENKAVCKSCGAELADGAKFCVKCGAQQAFCPSCGKQMQGEHKFCPNCGTDLSNSANDVQQDTRIQPEVKSSQYASQPKSTANGVASNAGEKLQTNRSLIRYILLGVVTFGIYDLYVYHKMAKDVNVACAGDGENTSGLLSYILLSIVTFSIYSIIWHYKLGNRLVKNAPRYGLSFKHDGLIVCICTSILGVFTGLAPFLGVYILLENTNAICDAYNKAHNL